MINSTLISQISMSYTLHFTFINKPLIKLIIILNSSKPRRVVIGFPLFINSGNRFIPTFPTGPVLGVPIEVSGSRFPLPEFVG